METVASDPADVTDQEYILQMLTGIEEVCQQSRDLDGYRSIAMAVKFIKSVIRNWETAKAEYWAQLNDLVKQDYENLNQEGDKP